MFFAFENDNQRHRWAVSVSMFVLGITFASWASRIPDIQRALMLTDVELGLVLFAMPLGQFPSMAVAPKIIGKWGARRVILASLSAFSLSLILLSLAPSKHLLMGSMLIFGAMNSFLNISNNTQAVAIEKAYGRSIMSSFHGCWSLGGVVGGFFGGIAASLSATPFIHFTLICLMNLALGWSIRHQLLRDDTLQAQESDTAKAAKTAVKLYREPLLIMCGIVGFLCMFTEGVMYDWNAVYFVSVLGVDGLTARSGYLAAMLAMVVGRFTADDIINRYGRKMVLYLSALSMTLGLIGLAVFSSPILATFASAFVGFGMASVVPIVYSMAGQSPRVTAQASISFVSAISFWGFVMGPPLIGFMSELWGLQRAFEIVVLAPVLVGLLATPLMKSISR